MNRRLSLSLALVVAFGAGAFVARSAVSDEPPAEKPSPKDEMMKEWMKMMAPGPQHELLKAMEGNWVGKGTWTEEGTTFKSTGEMTSKLVYGGRFVQSEMKSTMIMEGAPPMTMVGVMFLGFDNAKQKYVQSMLGDWSTAIGTSEGTYDAATKTFTMTGVEALGPGKERKFRVVHKIVSADEFVMDMYVTQPDGKEVKAGDASYKRK